MSRLGRWASPDPAEIHALSGGEGLNAYHYVSGNLLQARDPLGLWPDISWDDLKENVTRAGLQVAATVVGAGDALLDGKISETLMITNPHEFATAMSDPITQTTYVMAHTVAATKTTTFGGGVAGGGVAACVTGVGCPGGALAIAGGMALSTYGVYQASQVGNRLAKIQNFSKGSGGDRRKDAPKKPREAKALDPSENKGWEREKKVAELTGGRTARDGPRGKDVEIRVSDGKARPDVYGRNGELIAVGGPKKVENLSKEKSRLINLKEAPGQVPGRTAEAWYTSDTPSSVIDQAKEVLGEGNVHTFEDVP